MYGKDEAKELKTLFWTSFGKFMRKHKTEYGSKIQWINYRTGVKDIYFRLDADKRTARVCLDIQHKDEGIRELFYDQFLEVKTVFTEMTGQDWNWLKNYTNEYGHNMSRLFVEIEGVNMYNKDHWAEIFNFYEQALVGLDEFWNEFKDLFKNLQD